MWYMDWKFRWYKCWQLETPTSLTTIGIPGIAKLNRLEPTSPESDVRSFNHWYKLTYTLVAFIQLHWRANRHQQLLPVLCLIIIHSTIIYLVRALKECFDKKIPEGLFLFRGLPNLCGLAVFRLVQAQNQWVATLLDPVSVMCDNYNNI